MRIVLIIALTIDCDLNDVIYFGQDKSLQNQNWLLLLFILHCNKLWKTLFLSLYQDDSFFGYNKKLSNKDVNSPLLLQLYNNFLDPEANRLWKPYVHYFGATENRKIAILFTSLWSSVNYSLHQQQSCWCLISWRSLQYHLLLEICSEEENPVDSWQNRPY